jgi:hypothetical protein
MVKKYFACFPLLLQMGILFTNVIPLVSDKEKSSAILSEAKTLFTRVKTESEDAELIKSALYMEASCSIMLGNPNETIELLGSIDESMLPHRVLLASAYQLIDRHSEAETVLQVGIYQNITSALGLLSTYAMIAATPTDKFDEIVNRTFALAEAFQIKSFSPSTIISFYLVAAQGYMARENADKALDLIEQYTELVLSGNALMFHNKSDNFFSLIDNWLYDNNTTQAIEPHESLKQSLVDVVVSNPMFSALNDNPRFQTVMKRLKMNN